MKKIFILTFLAIIVVFLSGCSLSGGNPSGGGILKSSDGGNSWDLKIKIDDKKTIASVNVLSIAIHPLDNQKIYIGTEKNGIFMTENGGEVWSQTSVKLPSIYGIVINKNNPQIMYATGIVNKKGKIIKTDNGGTDWNEVYTEPADGTSVSSLKASPFNSEILYAGTSQGTIIRSTDGGKSWDNLHKADGPVFDIDFDSQNASLVYFGIFNDGILRTSDGGKIFEDIVGKIGESKVSIGSNIYSIESDPYRSGVLYVGTDKGMARSFDRGETWVNIDIIESSKGFPIRAVAINPSNSKEIIYSTAQAVYKSIDEGVNWSTYQIKPQRGAGIIKYDHLNPLNIYLGLRDI